MHLPTLLLKLFLFLATTAFAAPALLTKRVMYNMNLEAIPDYPLDHDKNGNPIPPADWPHYDSIDLLCEPQKKNVPRISIKKWKKECPHKIYQWKIDHNVFESIFLADQARRDELRRKEDEARRKQEAEEKRERMLEDCRKKPDSRWCRTLLRPHAGVKTGGKNEGKKQGGDGVEVVA